jgi:flagellar FliL protein
MKTFLLSVRVFVVGLLLCLHVAPSLASSESQSNSSLYFAIEQPFVVNLSGAANLTYLQVNVQFKLKKPEFRAPLQTQLPAIEHTMVMLLSDQTVNSIKSVQGKQALRETALKSIQQLCQTLIGDPAIDDVYFTGFIIQ